MSPIKINQHSALILVDIQNDFLSGGALAVPQGDEIIETANQLQEYFNMIIASHDFHPENHSSFEIDWPVHCVQDTRGAEFPEKLNTEKIRKIIHKGTDVKIDSYSIFFDNAHVKKTELDDYLKTNKITDIYILGLATDYCVKYSVLDGLKLGYNVYLIQDACRGINLQPDDIKNALLEMKNAGAHLISSRDILLADETWRLKA